LLFSVLHFFECCFFDCSSCRILIFDICYTLSVVCVTCVFSLFFLWLLIYFILFFLFFLLLFVVFSLFIVFLAIVLLGIVTVSLFFLLVFSNLIY
jgi:hypothetical protein